MSHGCTCRCPCRASLDTWATVRPGMRADPVCLGASKLRTRKSAFFFTKALNLLRIRASGVGGSLSPS